MTKHERNFLGKIKRYGCIACRHIAGKYHPGDRFAVCEAHHIHTGKRIGHWAVIPLCYNHHRGKDSIHQRKSWFRKAYLHEYELLLIIRKVFSLTGDWPEWAEVALNEYLAGKTASHELKTFIKRKNKVDFCGVNDLYYKERRK